MAGVLNLTAAVSDAERIATLIGLFAPLAAKADPWPIHWISGGDAGPDYCLPCCKAVARHARRTREYPDARVDGGWDDRRASDGPSYCGGCGRLLGYHLTSYGMKEELDYWSGDDGSTLLMPEHAFQIRAVLEAAQYEGRDEDVVAAIGIGDRMAALLPTGAPIIGAQL